MLLPDRGCSAGSDVFALILTRHGSYAMVCDIKIAYKINRLQQLVEGELEMASIHCLYISLYTRSWR